MEKISAVKMLQQNLDALGQQLDYLDRLEALCGFIEAHYEKALTYYEQSWGTAEEPVAEAYYLSATYLQRCAEYVTL
jgi:hypothetical protein